MYFSPAMYASKIISFSAELSPRLLIPYVEDDKVARSEGVMKDSEES
jgi:hypothetical protein